MSDAPERRFIGRAGLVKRLRLMEGEAGETTYRDGEVRIVRASEDLRIRPAFPLHHSSAYDVVRVSPLIEELERDRIVAVLLVRLGGFVAGVLEGESIVASKVGSRFVKGRHRAGGSSANRFRRRREKQARELVEDAGETGLEILTPWLDRVEHVALGGDRAAIRAVLERTPQARVLEERALPRFFTVPEPRLRVLEAFPYDLYSSWVEVGDR